MDCTSGSGLIFMKIGTHAQEAIEHIVQRKRVELGSAGKIFWGYGGSTCHPIRSVRPFVYAYANVGKTVHLVMQKMTSRQFAEPDLAKEYSDDGVVWQPIPRGIEVRGSRYAMVLGSLQDDSLFLNLNAIKVSMGPCRGRLASEYLRGRVDKGCFEVIAPAFDARDGYPLTKHRVSIQLTAKLVEPYAVLLR
jgi:hypothetical protein